jgi:hypothetical protein
LGPSLARYESMVTGVVTGVIDGHISATCAVAAPGGNALVTVSAPATKDRDRHPPRRRKRRAFLI